MSKIPESSDDMIGKLINDINRYLYAEESCLDKNLLKKMWSEGDGLTRDRIGYVMERQGLVKLWSERDFRRVDDVVDEHRRGMLNYFANKYDWLTAEKLTRDDEDLCV